MFRAKKQILRLTPQAEERLGPLSPLMNTGHFTAPLQGARLILGLYPGQRFACPGLLSFGPYGAFFYRAECSFQAYPADAGQAALDDNSILLRASETPHQAVAWDGLVSLQ